MFIHSWTFNIEKEGSENVASDATGVVKVKVAVLPYQAEALFFPLQFPSVPLKKRASFQGEDGLLFSKPPEEY